MAKCGVRNMCGNMQHCIMLFPHTKLYVEISHCKLPFSSRKKKCCKKIICERSQPQYGIAGE